LTEEIETEIVKPTAVVAVLKADFAAAQAKLEEMP